MDINIALDSQEIAKCSQRLENLANSLASQKLDYLVKDLSESALESVSAGFSGEEISSFLEKRGNASYDVVAEGREVKFIEFGVGVVGESGSYEGQLPSDWQYDARWTPAAHDPKDPTYWHYYDESNMLHRTNGELPKCVMLNSARDIKRKVKSEAKKVLSV